MAKNILRGSEGSKGRNTRMQFSLLKMHCFISNFYKLKKFYFLILIKLFDQIELNYFLVKKNKCFVFVNVTKFFA